MLNYPYQARKCFYFGKKEEFSMKKKEEKVSKSVKETKQKKKVKTTKNKKEGFLKGIKKELKKVSWPSKKDVIKYSVATLVFCIIIMIFFQLLNLGLSVVKGVFN